MISCRNISFKDDLDWQVLIDKSKTATFFQTREWLKIWVKNFGGEIKILGGFDGKSF